MTPSMSSARAAALLAGTALFVGCVSLNTHNDTVAKLDKARKVLSQASEEIKSLQQDKARLEQDKARLEKEAENLKKGLADLESAATQAKQEFAKLRTDLEAAERERAEREAKVQELSRARDDLARALESEIAKEQVAIQQTQDQLAVTMVDHVLFRSGQTEMTPEGLKVLTQLAETLKKVPDKQIHIEGHTDNKGIGPKLRDKYPTNWELSTARAASVVRHLVEQGGLGRERLTAVGYADTRPVASNDSRAGRQANRRIEIILSSTPLAVPAPPGSNSK